MGSLGACPTVVASRFSWQKPLVAGSLVTWDRVHRNME